MNSNALRTKLVQSLGVPDYLLNRLILRAPHTYKVYTIPKKSYGRRTIAQPAKETKYIQHWLMNNIFKMLPLHECATAYRPGASIKYNANVHAKNSYIAKFDFKDFFTSIKDGHLKQHLKNHLADILSDDDISDIVRISCVSLPGKNSMCLSIGAPSSPILSNSIMFEFDSNVSEWCNANGISYTRYADDLTFSTSKKGMLSNVEAVIRKIARNSESLALRFNRKKTVHLSKKHQRRITGLVISNDNKVSLGRARKRQISSMVHKYVIKTLNEDQIYHLQPVEY